MRVPSRARLALLVVGVMVMAVAMGWLVARRQSARHATLPPLPTAAPTAVPTAALPTMDVSRFPTASPVARPAACRNQLAASSGGWYLPWEDEANPGLLAEQVRQVDQVNFFWLSLLGPDKVAPSPDGQTARSLDTVLAVAHQANSCALRLVTLVDDHLKKDDMHKILFDPAAQDQFLRAAANEMAHHPLADGLTLDFEYAIPGSQAELQGKSLDDAARALSTLVGKLKVAMQHQGRLLTMTVPVRSKGAVPAPDWVKPFVFDYAQLAAYTDQVVVMALDYHWATGDPGEIAPRESVTNDVAFIRALVGTKLAVEVPAFARDWKVASTNDLTHIAPGTAAQDLSMMELAVLQRQYQSRWRETRRIEDEVAYSYTDNEGKPHVVWVTQADKKVAALRELGLPLVVWALSGQNPQGSQAILSALAKM